MSQLGDVNDFYSVTCIIAAFHLKESRSVTLENVFPVKVQRFPLVRSPKEVNAALLRKALLEFGAL